MKLSHISIGSMAALLLLGAAAADAATRKPNIVFVMADDLGWSDVGFNGATFYETPAIDRLCSTGMKFNRAYSGGPNCLPTRACLISGMYTPRTQIWTPGGHSKGKVNYMKLKVPNITNRGADAWKTIPSEEALRPSVVSIAEVLSAAGYKTARFGKWHVGRDTQGFDISDLSGKGQAGTKFYGNPDVHEWLTDASVQFIEDHKEQPFFLYLSHWDVHTPIRARKEVVARYKKKLKSENWDRKWNPTYAAMIHAVDLSVQRVYAKLEELGLAENTLFIFSSDNGGVSHVTSNHPLKGGKGAFSEGGVRVPTFMTWPKTIQAGAECDTPVTSVDFMPTFAELAGATLPTTQPVDGASIVPLLKGGAIAERSIFWHYPLYLKGSSAGDRIEPILGTDRMYWRAVPSSMIVRGDWKLVHYFETDTRRLYNLSEDLSESEDLSAKYPEMAQALQTELTQWQQETKAVIPTEINDEFKPQGSSSPAGK